MNISNAAARKKKPARQRSSPRKRKRANGFAREAEEMVRAIREGEVDALVVAAPEGERVVTLRNAHYLAGCILEQASEAIFICDADGRILRASLVARQLCHSPCEFQPFDKSVKLEYVNDNGQRPFSIKDVLAGKPLQQVQVRGHNGLSDRTFLMNAQPLLQGKKIVGALLILFDVTERIAMDSERQRLLEREKTAREEAEAANRAKDAFLATLSHEMRTPLSAMLGWVKLLRSGSLNPEQIERGLATIERNVQAQTNLIEDLLDVSRIVSGKLQLTLVPLDLGDIVRQACDAISPACAAKRIDFSCSIIGGPHFVRGDAERLRQIFDNLLNNAVKFTPAGGSIRVRCSRLHSSIQVVISDTGVGIEASFLPHIFERFRQANIRHDRSTKGLGLGLALVRHLVELQGGTVYADSPGKDQGSTFYVKLPVSALTQPHSHPSGEVPPAAVALNGAPRVLVVEDDVDSRELLAFMLTKAGADVREAADTSQAESLIVRWEPHVIICDVGLPRESGIEFIKRLNAAGKKVPAIGITAFVDPATRDRALNAGYAAYFYKPADVDDLIRAINELAPAR